MYLFIKSILKKILPKTILFKFELFFRFCYYLFYIGNNYKCNICDANIRKFIFNNNTKLCPKCGSTSRNRILWNVLINDFIKNGIEILDFSPSRSIFRKMKNLKNINYTATDLSGDFLSDKNYDITNISCEDNKFDLIICFHILEHIVDDKKAMTELFRILKKNGICIIQTPFKDGEIYEDFKITEKKERLKHFFQEDHVRIYSVQGLIDRLKKVGFEVELLKISNQETNKNGFNQNEEILICYKL